MSFARKKANGPAVETLKAAPDVFLTDAAP